MRLLSRTVAAGLRVGRVVRGLRVVLGRLHDRLGPRLRGRPRVLGRQIVGASTRTDARAEVVGLVTLFTRRRRISHTSADAVGPVHHLAHRLRGRAQAQTDDDDHQTLHDISLPVDFQQDLLECGQSELIFKFSAPKQKQVRYFYQSSASLPL